MGSKICTCVVFPFICCGSQAQVTQSKKFKIRSTTKYPTDYSPETQGAQVSLNKHRSKLQITLLNMTFYPVTLMVKQVVQLSLVLLPVSLDQSQSCAAAISIILEENLKHKGGENPEPAGVRT